METRSNRGLAAYRAALALLTALALCPVLASLANAGDYRCTIPVGEIRIQPASDGYEHISIPGFGHLSEAGRPALPSRTFCIALPPGERAVSVALLGAGRRTADGLHLLEPARPASTGDEGRAASPRADPAAYSSDDPFPARPVNLLGQGAFRKYNLAYVQVTPVVYRAASREVSWYPSVEIIIHHEPEAALAPDPALASEWLPEAESAARRIIANYDEAGAWYGRGSVSIAGAAAGYVIVTPASCRDAVRPLENWEALKGKSVHVVTVESLPGSGTFDTQRQIRDYLRGQLGPWSILYVLLVGTSDSGAPMRATNPSGDHSSYIWTDYYFADLTSPDAWGWDSNVNGYYAEWGKDYPDKVPEVAVGRIPFTDPATVEAVCRNMVSYELNGDMYFKKNVLLPMAFSADDTDNAVLGERMISDIFAPRSWSYTRLYENNATYQTTYPFEASLNAAHTSAYLATGNYGFVAWQGHGSHQEAYYGSGQPFISALSWPSIPTYHQTFIYSGSCYNGGVGFPPDSLSRFALQHGVVGIVASTDMSAYFHDWTQPDLYGDQTAEYLFCDNVTYGQSVGWAQQNANHTCWTQTPSWKDDWRKDCFTINLMNVLYGNPAMVLGTQSPPLPNLQAAIPSGWQHYIVPRGSKDATPGSCWTTPTLPGNQDSTYFSLAYRNSGPGLAPPHESRVFVDGSPLIVQTCSALSPSQMPMFQNIGPFEITGGRHSVYYQLDTGDSVFESAEGDNGGGWQCVWEPYWLANGLAVTRSAPPDKDAHGSIAGTVYDNCDGFGVSTIPSGAFNWWSAIGILPSVASADYDIRLYNSAGYGNSTSGFAGDYVKSSDQGAGKADFVLVNSRNAGSGSFYAGVVNYNGTMPYRIERSGSLQLTSRPASLWSGYYNYGTGNVIDMFECYLTPGTWHFYLDQVSGNCNMGFSLYDQAASYARRSDAMGLADSAGGGLDEHFSANITTSGWYGLAVWKSGATDSYKSSVYRVGFGKSGAIVVTSPAAGEVWSNGDTRTIAWDNTGTPDATVSIQLLRSGYTPQTIASNIANNGTYSWVISGVPQASDYQVKVFSASNSDTSDGTFTIQTKTITLTAPADGAVWGTGESKSITWASKGVTGNVRIELSRDGGASWSDIAASAANTGTYSWTVTGPDSAECRIRVSSVLDPAVADANGDDFSIGARSIAVLIPNGSETWIVGESREIAWESKFVDGNVRIELTRDGRQWSDLSASAPDTGTFGWTVTGPPSTSCKVRISSVLHPEVTDTSDASFTIGQRSIQVMAPTGGANWLIGESHQITWNTRYMSGGNVDVRLSRDNGATWDSIAANIPDTGSCSWTAAAPASVQCRVRVTSVEYPTVEGTNPSAFTIAAGSLNVTAPNGGETWHCGQSGAIAWTSSGIDGSLYLEMSRNGGADWAIVGTSVANTGTLSWPVGYPASSQCRIRLTSTNHPQIRDASDANFTIQGLSAPGTPADAGVWTTSPSISFSWSAPPDPVGSIAEYYVIIGTMPGRGDVFEGWTGSASPSKTISGSVGSTYFCRVRAKDTAGNISPWSGISDGIAVVEYPAASISQAKMLGNGVSVGIGAKSVTGVLNGWIYIEEAGRASGLRVKLLSISPETAVGSVVDVAGVMKTTSDGERYIEGAVAANGGASSLLPLCIRLRYLGGSDWFYSPATGAGQRGVSGGVGLNNTGLLAEVAGRVVEVEAPTPPALPSWFKVSDGSTGSPVKCVVPYGTVIDPSWQWVRLFGLSSCEMSGGLIQPLLLVRGQSDIVVEE